MKYFANRTNACTQNISVLLEQSSMVRMFQTFSFIRSSTVCVFHLCLQVDKILLTHDTEVRQAFPQPFPFSVLPLFLPSLYFPQPQTVMSPAEQAHHVCVLQLMRGNKIKLSPRHNTGGATEGRRGSAEFSHPPKSTLQQVPTQQSSSHSVGFPSSLQRTFH